MSLPPTIQDSYNVADFRIGLEAEKWVAAFYVDNISDEMGNQFINNRWAARRVSINRPRTFGLRFRYQFF